MLCRLQWGKRDAFGGYLGRDRNFFKPVDSPLEVVQAAEEYASAITGRKGRVSIADDMDLFAIERRSHGAAQVPLSDSASRSAQPQEAAVA